MVSKILYGFNRKIFQWLNSAVASQSAFHPCPIQLLGSQLTFSRTRRIKCDQTKPSCLKCTSSGRVCDGYPLDNVIRNTTTTTWANTKLTQRAANSINSPDTQIRTSPCSSSSCTLISATPQLNLGPLCSSLPLFPRSTQEQQLFNVFRHQLAPTLGGYLDSGFWSVTLPRIADYQLPVLQAILAITAIEQPTTLEPGQSGLGKQDISIIFYNRAINSLKTLLSNEGPSQPIVLLTCFLFICFEFKRGNAEVALNHLQSGLGILCAHEVPPIDDRSELSDINDQLVRAFYRLSIQSSLVGRQPPASFHRSLKDPSSYTKAIFTSLTDARESLTSIFVRSLRPTHLEGNVDNSDAALDEKRSRRGDYIVQLQEWNSRLGLFMIDCLPNPSQQDMRVIRIMRIQSLVASIWNATTVPSSAEDFSHECAFDSCVAEFDKILSLAALCIDDDDTTTSASTLSSSDSSATYPAPSFSLEMGIIFALYFTAIKCRSPDTRRRASYFLSQVNPQREGMWDAMVLRAISQYVVEFEESGCLGSVTVDPETWPLEEQRIHGIYIDPHCDLQGRVQKVTFVWRPGVWRDWEKNIKF